MKDNDRINELTIDEWIWVIFIILSIMNIIGDECEKNFCRYHTDHDKSLSKKIFTITVFVSFLIYIYIGYQRYQTSKKTPFYSAKKSICDTRLFGSILVVIASFLFLYCQLKDPKDENPLIL